MKLFHLIVSTPEKILMNSEVEKVQVTTSSGIIEIWADHQKLFSSLTVGMLETFAPEGNQRFILNGGVLDFAHNALQVSAPEVVSIQKPAEFAAYLENLKHKNQQVEQTIQNAVQKGRYYEAQVDDQYLFNEERLAKLELMQEVMGKE